MTTPPPFPDPRKTDAEQLNLLAIFHFVGAGLAVAALLFLLLHFTIFRTILSNPEFMKNSGGPPPPMFFFALFQWFYLIFGLWFLASGILSLISGFYLRARKHRTFSLVVAGLLCLHIPLGTVLGIFTIIVLSRESVRQWYDELAQK